MSVVEEAYVCEFGDFVFVDSESLGTAIRLDVRSEVASVFIRDVLLSILPDHVAQA